MKSYQNGDSVFSVILPSVRMILHQQVYLLDFHPFTLGLLLVMIKADNYLNHQID